MLSVCDLLVFFTDLEYIWQWGHLISLKTIYVIAVWDIKNQHKQNQVRGLGPFSAAFMLSGGGSSQMELYFAKKSFQS